MKLPGKFVEDGLKLAEGCRLFGLSFDELTRDELIAAAAHGWDYARKVREQAMSSSQMMREIYDMRGARQ